MSDQTDGHYALDWLERRQKRRDGFTKNKTQEASKNIILMDKTSSKEQSPPFKIRLLNIY